MLRVLLVERKWRTMASMQSTTLGGRPPLGPRSIGRPGAIPPLRHGETNSCPVGRLAKLGGVPHPKQQGIPRRPREPGYRLFTTASVRGIFHNPFYAGRVRHRHQLLPGAYEPLVSTEVFDAVQAAMKRNSGRSRTLKPRPVREYLRKGLIGCAHCLMPMCAQTFNNGHRYYREQRGSRGSGYCVGRSGSIPCRIPDVQMGRIVSAIVLPRRLDGPGPGPGLCGR